MRIKNIRLTKFKRFTDTTVGEIPSSARLVVVTGPNGSGKSAIFEGLNLFRRMYTFGVSEDPSYFDKVGTEAGPVGERVAVEFHGPSIGQDRERLKKSIWVRTAFRHQADLDVATISRMPPQTDDAGAYRLIDMEGYVADNYSRISSNALSVFLNKEHRDTAAGELADGLIGPLQSAVRNVFDDLELDALTDPMDQASFYFSKGQSQGFHYKNLSAGERAAFDLLLDMYVRTRTFNDTVFCIDEPEVHLGSRVQARLLDELLKMLPSSCQLWVATHSPGMMRAAMKIYQASPNQVVFLDTYDKSFDQAQVLAPVKPTTAFWKRNLEIALDDIAGLIAPDELVLCEGSGNTDGFDAMCYRTIFSKERSSVEFISIGNSHEVKRDSKGVADAIHVVAPGTKVIRVVDRDSHSDEEIETLESEGVRVLSVRNIEGYLLADDVLAKICEKYGRPELAEAAVSHRETRLAESVSRGNYVDDLKKVAGQMKDYLARELSITQPGSNTSTFFKEIVAPLIAPGMPTYQAMKAAIFGED